MKNKVFRFALVLCVAMLFASCFSSYKLVLGDNSSAGGSADISFYGVFDIKQWNSTDIFLDLYKKEEREKSTIDIATLTVPAGLNSFTFDVSIYVQESSLIEKVITRHEFNNVTLEYLLEAGKKYRVDSIVKSKGFFAKTADLYLGIYDITETKEDPPLLKEWLIRENV